MSQLTDKYGGAYIMAENMGCTDMSTHEENGVMTITLTAPTQMIANSIWDAFKEIDPDLDDGDLVVNMTTATKDYYGDYEVKRGDSLSAIAKKLAGGRITYMQIFELNRDLLHDPNVIHPGQKLKIPWFE